MHLCDGGGCFDGGDCCNLFGDSGCSGCLMTDVGRDGHFNGGATPVFDRERCTLF